MRKENARKIPSIAILIAGGILNPIALTLLGILLAVKDPVTEASQAFIYVFSFQVLTGVCIGLVAIGIALIRAAVNPSATRWWISLLFSFGAFLLSIIVVALLSKSSEPLSEASQWPSGTLAYRVIVAQIVTGLVVSGFVGVLRRRIALEPNKPE